MVKKAATSGDDGERTAPKTGRRPGESGTRDLISAAARRQFAERGYDRTTMRSIATEAGVDPSLVVHFFGTKKALFDEVINLPFDPVALTDTITGAPDPDRGEQFARHVVNLLHDPEYREALTGLIRAATGDPEVAELFRQRHRRDVLLPLARDLDIDHAELRVALAATQTIGLVMGRHVMKIDALAELTDDEMVALIGPTLQRYLTMPL